MFAFSRTARRRSATGNRVAGTAAFAFALVCSAALVFPHDAASQESKPEDDAKEPVAFRLMVGHLSQKPGPVDPELQKLHQILAKEFRYQSMRVLKTREMMLRLEEVGAIDLPTGKRVQIRPMHLGRRGVLVAVDIEDSGQLDLRVPNHRPVVLGTENYDGGKLFFTLQPEY